MLLRRQHGGALREIAISDAVPEHAVGGFDAAFEVPEDGMIHPVKFLHGLAVAALGAVVLGSLRSAIVATLIMVFAFTLGTYLIPQILGRPQHWTLSVLITDEAVYHSNLPLAAAMAVFFMVVSLALVGLTETGHGITSRYVLFQIGTSLT